MAGLIAQYQQGAFTTPINGTTSDAAVVLSNDNATRVKHNSHDSDPTIHIQSSVLASRPAAGTAQQVWITTDGLRAYVDSGAAWGELAYLPIAGGTATGAILLTGSAGAGTSNYIGSDGGGGARLNAATGHVVTLGVANSDSLTVAAGGGVTLASTLAVTGAITASAGVVTASAGTTTASSLQLFTNSVTAITISSAQAVTLASALTLPLGGGTGLVSVGAVDSGGAGFRLLRVPN